MDQNHESTSRSWLQRLKDESWEAELLVSAAAIFIIFQSFSIFDWVCDFFIDWLNPDQYFVGYIITFLGFLAFGMLGALFVLHFAFRAYWIGLVGLNSVFSDYGVEDSAYSPIFTEKMMHKLPKLSKSVGTLDEICSVIFSVAFTLLIMYLYLGIISSIYLLIFNFLIDYLPVYIILTPLILVSVIYLAQTTLTIVGNFKKFKQNTKIQTWYYNATIWGSAILYGPLYKNLLQVTMIFGSNFKKKKALVRTMIFMLIFGMGLGIYQIFQSNVMYLLNSDRQNDQTKLFSQNYSTNNKEVNFLLAPEIQSEIISKKTIQLFIPIFHHETNLMSENCGLGDKKIIQDNDERQKKWQANLDCYSSKIILKLNEKPVSTDFLKTYHAVTNQFGLSGFIPLNELPIGLHELKITKEVSSEIEKSWKIPFYFSPD